MLTLDKDHVYRDGNGAIIPGVTSILKAAGLIDATWFNDYARDRGTLVHEACALYDRDDLDEQSLDPELEPYVRAWIKFRADSGFAPELVEHIVSNPLRGYAGKLDVTGVMNGHKYVIDRKSGAVQAWAGIQLAAYEACLPCPHKRAAIELDSDGKYRLIEYTDRNDFNVFLSALALTNWKHNKGVK